MKILAIIPARGGSKGVPGKNTKILGIKPLIAYSINKANESQLITKTIVSTDDSSIIKIAKEYHAEVPFVRPSELASDLASSISVVQHAIAFFEYNNEFFDAVCLLQPTSPFREKGFIDQAIEKFIDSRADSLVSVLPIPHEYNPHWAFEESENGLLKIATGDEKIIPRRQELPMAFHRDGAIYITKTEVLKNGSLYGKSIAFIESNPDFYVNIDTMKDWELAEKLLIKIHF